MHCAWVFLCRQLIQKSKTLFLDKQQRRWQREQHHQQIRRRRRLLWRLQLSLLLYYYYYFIRTNITAANTTVWQSVRWQRSRLFAVPIFVTLTINIISSLITSSLEKAKREWTMDLASVNAVECYSIHSILVDCCYLHLKSN